MSLKRNVHNITEHNIFVYRMATWQDAFSDKKIRTRKPCCRRETAWWRCNFPRWRPAAILYLIEPEIASFDPPTPKTLPYRTKHEVDRMTRSGDNGHSKFDISRGMHLGPPFLGKGGRIEGHRSYHWKERRWFPINCTLPAPIVVIALSLTIRPQFAVEYLRRSIQQGRVHFGSKF